MWSRLRYVEPEANVEDPPRVPGLSKVVKVVRRWDGGGVRRARNHTHGATRECGASVAAAVTVAVLVAAALSLTRECRGHARPLWARQ